MIVISAYPGVTDVLISVTFTTKSNFVPLHFE